MNSENTDHSDQKNGQELTLKGLLGAVLDCDIAKMGVDAVLKKLAAMCRNTEMAQKLGFTDTLTAYEKGLAIAQKADAKDQLAFAELKLISTVFNQLLANVVAKHPDMAAPFIRADVTWPVNQPYFKSESFEMPLERLKRLGFGANAKASGFPNLRSMFSLVALVLHFFLFVRDLLNGKQQKTMSGADAQAVALDKWDTSVRAAVEESYGKWSQLPIDEIGNIKETRQDRVGAEGKASGKATEVSGDVRFRIKGHFIKVAKLVHGLINIVRPKQ